MDKAILQKLVEDCGVSLYDTESVVENDQKIFRVFITKKGGVSLDKCAEITRIISPILDVDPPMGGAYSLEVSSPGIERKLSTLAHFQHSIGETVKVKLQGEDEADNITLIGRMMKATKEAIVLYDKTTQKDTTFTLSQVLKARTYVQW
jgi:ribosome maturation factor RimP